jgi:NAD(P)-dependent dehydrogenase (short-subunit alcohol dehydrogenase family)
MQESLPRGTKDLFDLTGRLVLVSGAGHGLGLATAAAFAGAGALVAAMDIDVSVLEKVATEQGFRAVLKADVQDTSSVDNAVAEAIGRLGGLDVVVNAAAQYPTGSLIDEPAELMEDVFATNVAGYARVVRAAFPALSQSRAGRVINFSSVMAFSADPPNLGAYVVSKAAIIGYTRALARELGPHGICVNSLAPGSIPTRSTAVVGDVAAFQERLMGIQCIKRFGRPEDIAATVMFLASEGAGFITGQTLLVDGGWIFD